VIQVQFQNIDNNEVDTFRDSRVQVVVSPAEYASGNFIYPYTGKK
jgi:branched-chain amino acid transport system substrate-binding protein